MYLVFMVEGEKEGLVGLFDKKEEAEKYAHQLNQEQQEALSKGHTTQNALFIIDEWQIGECRL